jgi:hypothetical protein
MSGLAQSGTTLADGAGRNHVCRYRTDAKDAGKPSNLADSAISDLLAPNDYAAQRSEVENAISRASIRNWTVTATRSKPSWSIKGWSAGQKLSIPRWMSPTVRPMTPDAGRACWRSGAVSSSRAGFTERAICQFTEQRKGRLTIKSSGKGQFFQSGQSQDFGQANQRGMFGLQATGAEQSGAAAVSKAGMPRRRITQHSRPCSSETKTATRRCRNCSRCAISRSTRFPRLWLAVRSRFRNSSSIIPARSQTTMWAEYLQQCGD